MCLKFEHNDKSIHTEKRFSAKMICQHYIYIYIIHGYYSNLFKINYTLVQRHSQGAKGTVPPLPEILRKFKNDFN